MTHPWEIQEEKDELDKLVKAVETDGPQIIYRHDEPVAVVLSHADYVRLMAPKNDLLEFFQSSPLAGIDLSLERDRSPDRDVDIQ